jgi:hypothetical protein
MTAEGNAYYETPPDDLSWLASNWNRPDWLKALYGLSAPFSNQVAKLALLPIADHPDTGSFKMMGRVRFRIRELDVKRLVRDIRIRRPDGVFDVPQPTAHDSGHATRWDMHLAPYFDKSGGPQRITIHFELDDSLLSYLWMGHFPITAKTPESQLLLANPRYGYKAGAWVSVDQLYDPGDPQLVGKAEYNIALLVRDREDAAFVVPLIIDPRMENEG